MTRLCLATTLATLAALSIGAGTAAAGPFQGRLLQRLDTNQDGGVDRGEFETAMANRFVRLDANRDGALDTDEIEIARERVARRLDAAMTVAENRMEKRDTDGDGKISRAEFVRVPALFDLADKDRDGRLDKDELAAARDAFGSR